MFINSFFSFYWDVTNDWGLDLLRFSTWSSNSSPSTMDASGGVGSQTVSAVGRLRQSLHKRGLSTNAYANRRASWRLSSLMSPITSSVEWLGGGVAEEDEEADSLLPRRVSKKQDEGGEAQYVPTSTPGEDAGVHQRVVNLTTPSTPHFTLAISEQGECAAGREGPEFPLGDATFVGSSSDGRGPHTKSSSSFLATLQPPASPSSTGGGHQRKRSAVLLRNPEKGVSMLFRPMTYQIIVVLDLILRFLWSIKLSSHLHHIVELEAGVFFIEALEIVRRWAWVFLRVEWEFVRHHRLHHPSSSQQQQHHHLAPPSRHAPSDGATIPSPILEEPALLHKGE